MAYPQATLEAGKPTGDAAKATGSLSAPDSKAQSPVLQPYADLRHTEQNTPDVAAETIRLLVSLAAVAVLVYIVVWLLRKFSHRSPLIGMLSAARSGRANIQLLETFHLAPTRTLHLLELAGEIYLIGSTPNNIAVLAHIDDPAKVSDLRERSSRAFGFVRELERKSEATAPEEPSGKRAASELTAKLEERLEAYRKSRRSE
jgi:flagellar biogenesis protein FliO